MNMTCQGKVALMTGGAGKGIGRSVALTLAREGAQIAVNYRTSKDSAEAIVDAIKDGGGEAIAIQADVFTADGCKKLVESAVERFGRIDICVINPGAGWHPRPIEAIDAELALADARQELAPIYHLMPLVLPQMYKRRWGRLIGISLEPGFGSPSYSYNVAKAARTSALMMANVSTRQHGVTVNVISPGPFSEVKSLGQAIELCKHGPGWINRGELAPQDVAEGIAFLCSEAGRFVNRTSLSY